MTDLINIESINVLEIFTNDGLDPVLEAITQEVKSFKPDMTTPAGRKNIASLAHKVAKSKTYLD